MDAKDGSILGGIWFSLKPGKDTEFMCENCNS